LANYIGVVHKDLDSEYSVSFPDFPGCISAGDTIDEAKDMAHEALQFHIEGMIEDGDRINITVPKNTLHRIDAFAKKRGMSRSSFLIHAAQSVINSDSYKNLDI
jgi:predicted RNase H-like HicB family nuclease